MAEIPVPTLADLALVAMAWFAGAATPFWWMVERLRGLGRWFLGRMPYRPPPGLDEDEAMRQARRRSDSGDEPDDDPDEQ
jgi:hypothetical protein